MWLINTDTLKLEFFMESKIPSYAILSHTWEDEELNFQELGQESARLKKGYAKILKTCEEARKQKLQYAWVDTCCIDKTSSAELTESINSMFAWYKQAAICYALLSDVTFEPDAEDNTDRLSGSRWFTRGWTLQELLAPSKILFYDRDWRLIGNKQSLAKEIASVTGIDSSVLMGMSRLGQRSVAERMHWASRRETTRTEDLAYCLLGIFDVHMPLIYGEGSRAFRRLQEEIIARGNDLTIFSWNMERDDPRNEQRLFAPSPAGFCSWPKVVPFMRATYDPEFSLTNKGLRFNEMSIGLYRADREYRREGDFPVRVLPRYLLLVGVSQRDGITMEHAVPLKKVGPSVFIRDGKVFAKESSKMLMDRRVHSLQSFHIQVERQTFHLFTFEGSAAEIHIPLHQKILISEVIPDNRWDEIGRVFFFKPFTGPGRILFAAHFQVLLISEDRHDTVDVVVCVLAHTNGATCVIFDPLELKNVPTWEWFIDHRTAGHQMGMKWNDVKDNVLDFHKFTQSVKFKRGGKVFIVSSAVEENLGAGAFESEAQGNSYSLLFDVKQQEVTTNRSRLPDLSTAMAITARTSMLKKIGNSMRRNK